MDFKDFKHLHEQGKVQEFCNKLIEIEQMNQFSQFSVDEKLQLYTYLFDNQAFLDFDRKDFEKNTLERLENIERDPELSTTYQFKLIKAIVTYFYLRKRGEDEKIFLKSDDQELQDLIQSNKIEKLWGIYNYFWKGVYLRYQSEWTQSLESFKQGLLIAQEMKDTFSISLMKIRMSFPYSELPDLKNAITVLIEAKDLAKKNNFILLQYYANFNLSFFYLNFGEYSNGLEAGLEGKANIEVLERINPNLHSMLRSGLLTNLGINYRGIGELIEAQKYLEESLSLRQADPDTPHEFFAETYSELGEVFRIKGDLIQAQKNLGLAMEHWESRTRIREDFYVPTTLFSLIRLYFDLQRPDQVKKCIDLLSKIKADSINDATKIKSDQMIRFANAILLKNSPRMAEKGEAIKILTTLIHDEIVLYDITALSMIHLSDLLIEEYKGFQESQVLEEAQNYITQLYELGRRNNVHPVTINALILQSKFLLLENKFDQALDSLEQAKKITMEKKLHKFEEKVNKEIENTESSINSTPMTKLSIRERIDQIKLDSYLKEVEKVMEIKKR